MQGNNVENHGAMSIPVVPLCSNCGHVWSGATLTSPSPTLIQSNEVPSDFEARHYRSMVLGAENDISRLDAEIARVQDVLDKLARNRDVLRRHVRDYRIVISPIRRVPPEIWSEIFLNCEPRKCPMTKQAPLSLTGVSRQWREIAISLPLWSDIRVDNTGKSMETQANWVKLWFSRSGTHPVTFEFHCKSLKIPNLVLDALIMHSPQWQAATFRISPHLLEAFAPITGRIQQLQMLDICQGYTPTSLVTSDAFKMAPSLREVHLSQLSWNTLSLPWAQLTRLYMELSSVRDAVQILCQSPNLEDCSFLFRDGETSAAPLQHIQHTRLRYLHIELGDLFEYVTLPNLCQLSVRGLQWPTPGFSLFLTRSLCTIEKLTLYVRQGGLDSVIPSLRQIPSISTLHLSNLSRYFVNELLTHLTYRPEQPLPCLLPNLREVHFSLCGMFPTEKLVEMIQSRRRKVDMEADGVVVRLRVVHIFVDCGVGLETLKLLQSLRGDDFSIKVSFSWGLRRRML